MGNVLTRIGAAPLTALFVALVLLIGISPAAGDRAEAASDESEQLYSKGLVLFHGANYGEAMKQFDAAVEADANNVYALYYRGVTYARVNDYANCIADLRRALKLRPGLDAAALELGVALVETTRYPEAIEPLQQAQKAKDLDASASLFLGLAQLRLGRSDEARENFARAAVRDPRLVVPSRYYQGVVAYQQRRWPEAEEHFEAVKEAAPASEMAKEAAAFLENIRGGARKKPYGVYGTLGFEYDSNVLLAPDGIVIGNPETITDEDDGRFTYTLGGYVVPWRTSASRISIGYELFQSQHFRLSDFDLQDHRASAQWVHQREWVRFGFLARYDYYLKDWDSFLQEGVAWPSVTFIEGSAGETEVYYRMRARDFKKALSELRDGFNHAVGIRQYLNLGTASRYVFLGYQYDKEDPTKDGTTLRFPGMRDDRNQNRSRFIDANEFGYDGHEVETGVGWTFPLGLEGEASYAYRHENYFKESRVDTDQARHDNEHQIFAALWKDLSANFRARCAYLGTFNNSNKPDEFEYERHIFSVALEARY